MKPRRHAKREEDPDTGEMRLTLRDPEVARKEIATQIKQTIRTAAALRALVLVGPNKTASSNTNCVDPLVQLCLIARDEYESSEEDGRFKFFKSMVDIYIEVDGKTQVQMRMLADGLEKDADRKQRDRHHRDKLEADREKRAGDPTDDQLKLIAGEVSDEE